MAPGAAGRRPTAWPAGGTAGIFPLAAVMGLTLTSAAFALAVLAAAAMGLALQRGGTCMLAAVDEVINKRRLTRLWALVEASAWVGAGLLLASGAGLRPHLPPAPELTTLTVAGAVLLGLGALLNGACVFGAVARLGNGQWSYLATPAGFYIGCLVALRLMPASAVATRPAGADTRLIQLPDWALASIVLAAAARVAVGVSLRRRSRGHSVWSPHAATASIGLIFLALLLLGGAWSYTDVLSELAHAMAKGLNDGLVPRLALAAALLGGAMTGGWLTGQWRARSPTPSGLARCFLGGCLMGCGSLLVPGGNDSLILLGMPLLWLSAWVAVAIMGSVIAAVLLGQRR